MPNVITFGPTKRQSVPKVYVRQNWSDSWAEEPYLHAIKIVDRVAPNIGEAQLLYHFGEHLKRADSLFPSVVAPLAYNNYYVKITATHPDAEEEELWYGIIQHDSVTLERSEEKTGSQEMTAYDLKYLLARRILHEAFAEDPTGILSEHVLGYAPTFNRKSKSGPPMVYPRGNLANPPAEIPGDVSGNAGPTLQDTYIFSNIDPGEFSAYDVARYLIRLMAPGTSGLPDSYDRNIPWALRWGGQEDGLVPETSLGIAVNENIEVWEQEGRSIKDILDELFGRKQGLVWWITVNERENEDDEVHVNVDSIFGSPVIVGNFTVPANSNIVTYNVPTGVPDAHIYRIPSFNYNATESYDALIVQGQRIKVCASFAYEDDNLFRDWTGAQQTDYNNATDVERASDKYRKVYLSHRVAKKGPNHSTDSDDWDHWDWECGDGEGGITNDNVSPETLDDGDVKIPDAVLPTNFWNFDTKFLRHLPLLEEIDYSQAQLTIPDDIELNYRPFMVLFKAQTSDPPGAIYMYADRMHEVNENISSGAHVTPHDNWLGVTLRPYANHQLGLNTFTGTSEIEASVDYETMVITGFFETNSRQHLKFEAATTTDANRTLVITVPDAEYWWVDPNAIIDIDANGAAVRIHDNHKVIRDDLSKLSAVHGFLLEWFTVKRQAVQIEVNGVSASAGVSAPLGTYIDEVTGKTLTEAVNTIVTGRTIDFRAQTTMTETGWLNLDSAVEAALGLV